MKFVIATQEFNYLINKCQNAVGQKSTIPVLSNFMIEALGNEIVITATDLTVGIRCVTEAKVLEEGRTTMPSKKLVLLLKELTAANVEVSTDANHVSEIIAGSSHFKLHGMGCNEFPAIPDLSDATQVRVHSKKLRDMFFRTAFAAAKEDGRYALTGVFLHLENGKARLVGTDARRLARTQLDVDVDPSFKGDFIIPSKSVEEMLKVLEGDGEATLFLMNDKIAIQTENALLVSKLLTGDYPDVTRVIPGKTDSTITLHREELMSLLKQVSLFTGNQAVKFSFNQGELQLAANTMDIGEGKVSMPVNYQGDSVSIAFNPDFFLDVLRHSKSETVQMGIIDSFSPGVITDSAEANVSLPEASPLYVLMPMRLT